MNHFFVNRLFPFFLAFALMPTISVAGFEEGVEAYKKGDFSTAMREWKPLADQGSAAAKNALGVLYENGEGVTQDNKVALHWFRQAADQGSVNAQLSLGRIYSDGKWDVAKDHEEALRWYRKAADQGNAIAQNQIGFFICGAIRTLPKDCTEALRMHRLAAEQGYASAQLQLGRYYSGNGGFVARDDAEAMRWSRLASASSDPLIRSLSLSAIAHMYEYGKGVSVNLLVAYAIRVAEDGAGTPFASTLDLGKRLSPQSMKEATELSRKMMVPGQFLKALDDFLK